MAKSKPQKIVPTVKPSQQANKKTKFEQEKPTKPSSPLQGQDVSDRITNRGLRIIYAVIAVCFAIASIVFWMRFIQFYYNPNKHSDTVFIAITSACTVNILAAFISIIKGLFPSRKD